MAASKDNPPPSPSKPSNASSARPEPSRPPSTQTANASTSAANNASTAAGNATDGPPETAVAAGRNATGPPRGPKPTTSTTGPETTATPTWQTASCSADITTCSSITTTGISPVPAARTGSTHPKTSTRNRHPGQCPTSPLPSPTSNKTDEGNKTVEGNRNERDTENPSRARGRALPAHQFGWRWWQAAQGYRGYSELFVGLRVTVPEAPRLERRNGGDLGMRQLKTEHIEVLPLAFRRRGLRNRNGTQLHMPTQHDLGRSHPVRLRNRLHNGFLTHIVAPRKRAPALGHDVVTGMELAQVPLGKTRMQLDLVDRRRDTGLGDDTLQVVLSEVTHPDRPHQTILAKFQHRLKSLHVLIDSRQWPVDQVQVDVVETQVRAGLLETLHRFVETMVTTGQLRGDKDLLTRNTGAPDRLPHLALILIVEGGIKQPISALQRRHNRVDPVIASELVGAEPERRQLVSIVERLHGNHEPILPRRTNDCISLNKCLVCCTCVQPRPTPPCEHASATLQCCYSAGTATHTPACGPSPPKPGSVRRSSFTISGRKTPFVESATSTSSVRSSGAMTNSASTRPATPWRAPCSAGSPTSTRTELRSTTCRGCSQTVQRLVTNSSTTSSTAQKS